MDRMTYGVLMFLHSRGGNHDECIRVNEQMEAVSGVFVYKTTLVSTMMLCVLGCSVLDFVFFDVCVLLGVFLLCARSPVSRWQAVGGTVVLW